MTSQTSAQKTDDREDALVGNEDGADDTMTVEESAAIPDADSNSDTGQAGAGGTDTQPRVMFVNWPDCSERHPSCDLLDGTDFSDCSLVFLDPLQFAMTHDLWPDLRNISKIQYVSLTEDDVRKYLVGLKLASESLHQLLANGGILIVRSNIPNCHIKVSKRSSAGTLSYTQSLVSTFFWLEELVGGYSIQYCNQRRLKYLVHSSPICHVFSDVAVRCRQTINSVGKGKQEVIASTGARPAISRVNLEPEPGSVYFVPCFEDDNEQDLLVKAFIGVLESPDTGTVRPDWLDAHSLSLERANPYPLKIDRATKQIEALSNEIAAFQEMQKELKRLTGLLYQGAREMAPVVLRTLEILGFQPIDSTVSPGGETFQVYQPGDNKERLAVSIAASANTPIEVSEVTNLIGYINNSRQARRPKGLLVANPSRALPPERRKELLTEEAVDEAEKNGVGIVLTTTLFEHLCHLLKDMNSDGFEEQLSQSRGVLLTGRGMIGRQQF